MKRFVVVDLETTGNHFKSRDKIIQIAALVIENGEVIEQLSTFLNPKIPIPKFITELTGIDSEMVQHAPLFEQIADELHTLFDDAIFVAHNVMFDLSFLQEEFERIGKPKLNTLSLDTVELTRILFPTLNSYKLSDLSSTFKIEHTNPHQADSDAEVTAELLGILLKKLHSLPYATLKHLYTISKQLKSDLHFYISSLLDEKSLMIISERDDITEYRGIAIRNEKFHLPQEDENFNDLHTYLVEDFDEQMEALVEFYHPRTEQKQYITDVYSSLTNSQLLIAEAGTGIGKTIGYLLPSAYFSKQQNKQICISTSTIALQNQLIQNQIPLLQKLVPFQFRVASIQSKRHYICLQKFEHILREDDDNYDLALTKAMISVWLTETTTGVLDEVSLPSGGYQLWNRIGCDNDSENRRGNPWYSKCFYQKAKNDLLLADLVITNHAYLLSTIQKHENTLQSVEHFIIDEAHLFEEVASRTFGTSFSCIKYNQLLSRLSTTDGVELINKLYQNVQNNNVKQNWWKKTDYYVRELKFESDELFRLIKDFILINQRDENKDNIRYSLAINHKLKKFSKWQVVKDSFDRFEMNSNNFNKHCEEFMIKQETDQMSSYIDSMINEFKMIVTELFQMKKELKEILFEENEEFVSWMETEAKGSFHSTFLYCERVKNQEMLKEFLYDKAKSILFTSATLSIQSSFDFFKNELGLTDYHLVEKIYSSPSEFKEGVTVLIPTDLEGIKELTGEEYAKQTGDYIFKIASKVNGRTLVLFTAYDLLKKTYEEVKMHQTEEKSLNLIGQGFSQGGKQRLIKQFLQTKQSILFGTNTFWEGIDLPNDELDCVIIVRLPFTSPEKPMYIAKSRLLKNEGKNSFAELALPLAIMKFKQGYGRLIRNEEDRGYFVILDNRITNSTYGSKFIEVLPNQNIIIDCLENLLGKIDGRSLVE